MAETDAKTTWLSSLTNLFRPESDMLKLEAEAKQLRSEIARLESERRGRILVEESDLVALKQEIRSIRERCLKLEDTLENVGFNQYVVGASDSKPFVGSTQAERLLLPHS